MQFGSVLLFLAKKSNHIIKHYAILDIAIWVMGAKKVWVTSGKFS